MRFLLDECADPRLAHHLRQQGHGATVVAIDYPASLTDRQVLQIARTEQRILLTNDRDFGELVFVRRQAHAGVIFLRLDPHTSLAGKIERLEHVLTHYESQLDQFLVVTNERVRVRQTCQLPGGPS